MQDEKPEVRLCQKWAQLGQEHREMIVNTTKFLYKKCLDELGHLPKVSVKSHLADQVYEIAMEHGVPITKTALKRHVMNEMMKLNRTGARHRNGWDRKDDKGKTRKTRNQARTIRVSPAGGGGFSFTVNTDTGAGRNERKKEVQE